MDRVKIEICEHEKSLCLVVWAQNDLDLFCNAVFENDLKTVEYWLKVPFMIKLEKLEVVC